MERKCCKCGSKGDDIVVRFKEKGNIITTNSLGSFSVFANVKAEKDLLFHHCRVCQFEWTEDTYVGRAIDEVLSEIGYKNASDPVHAEIIYKKDEEPENINLSFKVENGELHTAKPKIIKTYTLTLCDNGDLYRNNDGFTAIELLGIATKLKHDMIDLLNGIDIGVKKIVREAKIDKEEIKDGK
jgi:hypothetical protein